MIFTNPFIPVKNGYITSAYGPRILNNKQEFHPGIDIGSKEVKPAIYSPYDGVLAVSGFSPSFGNRVWIKLDKDVYLVLAHMESLSINLCVGMKILKGTQVGIMGNTGHSFGRHLHLEIRQDPFKPGNSINPLEISKLYEC